MSINSFDDRSTREISDTVVDVRNTPRTVHSLYQRQRHFWGAAGGKMTQKRGLPKAEIAAGADGVLVIHESGGATTEEVDVTNPYQMPLPDTLFCRVEHVTGWDKPFAVPDYFAICEELAPDLVAPTVGS